MQCMHVHDCLSLFVRACVRARVCVGVCVYICVCLCLWLCAALFVFAVVALFARESGSEIERQSDRG